MDASISGLVINTYRPTPWPGTMKEDCDGAKFEQGLNTPAGKRFVAADVVITYFFGQFNGDPANPAFDASTAKVKPAPALPDAKKYELLSNPKFLQEVYDLLVAANGGDPFANLFNPDGTAKDPEFGKLLYTCGAKGRWFTQNPNSNRVDFWDSLWLRKDALFNDVRGQLPERKVPLEMINALITKYTAQPAAPQPVVAAAEPPVISSLKPAAVRIGSGDKNVKLTGKHLSGAVLAVADENCNEAITMTPVSDTEISLMVATDKLAGAPKKCNISVGEATADLVVKNKSTGGGKPPKKDDDFCRAHPDTCL